VKTLLYKQGLLVLSEEILNHRRVFEGDSESMCLTTGIQKTSKMYGVRWFMRGTCCLERGPWPFSTERDIDVFSMSSLNFVEGGNTCSVCVCIRTHAHAVYMGYSDVSSGVGTRHLGNPTNPDGINLGISVFAYMYKVHMCVYIYAGRREEILD